MDYQKETLDRLHVGRLRLRKCMFGCRWKDGASKLEEAAVPQLDDFRGARIAGAWIALAPTILSTRVHLRPLIEPAAVAAFLAALAVRSTATARHFLSRSSINGEESFHLETDFAQANSTQDDGLTVPVLLFMEELE
ncbi:unnamed protein product [Dovyalis caffra]|uniref:Uncharacterized protein n=1 Tax=Dovyalis caffra TaxID=77055 RepID=A0AAV1QT21_9ROSI|nr:unnamed protein product [Dovyalis caffra]